MRRIGTQADWIARANEVLSAGGLANFDPGIVIRDGHGARVWDENGHETAAIIVEPLQRIIPPAPGYLQHLWEKTAKRGILLIFDEIVTGFRLTYGGAQALDRAGFPYRIMGDPT